MSTPPACACSRPAVVVLPAAGRPHIITTEADNADRAFGSTSSSAGVPQACGDAVDRERDDLSVTFRLGTVGIRQGAETAEHLDLQTVQGVHVWIAQV